MPVEKKRVCVVVGTRPEVIKTVPVISALKADPRFEVSVLATAQHRELLDSAFASLGVAVDIDLDLMAPGQTLSQLLGRVLPKVEASLLDQRPDIVLAQGDTTTVLGVAMVCFNMNIPFGHIEAGLRTGDLQNPFPEEFNRVVAGKIATLHFAPTSNSKAALLAEGVEESRILVTGNTGIDTLLKQSASLPMRDQGLGERDKLILMTSHRRENFGQPMRDAFAGLLKLLEEKENVHVLFPVHPNPNVIAAVDELLSGHPRIHLCPPMDYNEFVSALKAAYIVLTDSGGVQEEAPVLGKPVLVMRSETERPEAVYAGVSKLVGTDSERVYRECLRLIDDPIAYSEMSKGVSPYGDGEASNRIVEFIARYFGMASERDLVEFSA